MTLLRGAEMGLFLGAGMVIDWCLYYGGNDCVNGLKGLMLGLGNVIQ